LTELLKVTAYPSHKNWPIFVEDEHTNLTLLSVTEAEEVIEELKAAVEKAKDGPIVQVRYATGGIPYAYRDPSGTLRCGDLVEVPVTYGTKVGTVVGFGRDGWDGEVKAVVAKLTRQEL
jgi:N-acetylmuramic acid 6-phosphate (MurNAc-6-P) etherase